MSHKLVTICTRGLNYFVQKRKITQIGKEVKRSIKAKHNFGSLYTDYSLCTIVDQYTGFAQNDMTLTLIELKRLIIKSKC